MADEKQVTGKCVEIGKKGEWVTFHIDVGSQYPVKLSTKFPEMTEAAEAVGAQECVWTFAETQGGENPHKPGTFYTNRYLGKVEPVAPVKVTVEEEAGPVDWDGKERRIVRQACLKVASVAGPLIYPKEFGASALLTLAEMCETWVYRDVPVPGDDDERVPDDMDSIPF